MGLSVYSRLGDLLRVHNLTVGDLQDRITARFGLVVDARTLNRLAHADRIRRADLEIAAAVPYALYMGLDDIFAVDTVRTGEDGTVDPYDPAVEDNILDPEQSRR